MATVSNIATTSDRSDDRSRRRRKTLARVGIAGGALLAAAVFLPSALATWLEVDHPTIATRIAPWNAAAAADAAASQASNPRAPEVRSLVQKTLARDLTNVQAIELRAVDLALSGKKQQARQLFALSDELSRRSLPTRLWLIQDAVDHGKVAGALRNFDIALRTTTDSQPILFPVLAKASADPTLTIALAQTFDRRSEWRLLFFEWVTANAADVRPVANVVMHMRDARFVRANDIDQHLIERLVSDRQFDAARLINRRYGRHSEGVADPNFRDASAHYPFGWGLVSTGSLEGARALIGSSSVLTYSAAPANSGQVAAQLLGLAAGDYVLAAKTATNVSGAAPYWSLTCAQEDGEEIARLDQPMSAGAAGRTRFTVPARCGSQWLTLRIRPAPDSNSQEGAIAWVNIAAR